ncbi:MAG: vitamin B12 dependent methionine synthase [Chloroflexi bacterium]|nr:vitamin B12 dependent methionine synthase [Chloroflexota bacterium]
MHTHLLDSISFSLDRNELASKLHVRGEDLAVEFQHFLSEAQEIARPKGLYKVSGITAKRETSVTIEQSTFSSRVLRVNLEKANRAFPYIATCGEELEQWGYSQKDMLKRFWADGIQMAALYAAVQAIRDHIDEHYRTQDMSMMNPGSLADWPLREQRVLFRLLGDPRSAIGVELKESLMMAPTKSTSGLFFPLEESFESCQLCPMADCPARRAPYDATLYAKKYGEAIP